MRKGYHVREHTRRTRKTGVVYKAGHVSMPPKEEDVDWLYKCAYKLGTCPQTIMQNARYILEANKDEKPTCPTPQAKD